MSEQPSGGAADGSSPAWRITERSVEVAQGRADMWLTFAGRALKRAHEAGSLRWGLVTECWAFVVAVDHLRTCAVMAKTTATVDGVAADIADALDAFDQAAPDVANMRDVLEHHDDAYVLGAGRLQHGGRFPQKGIVDEALAADWGVWCGYFDAPDCRRPWVRIGPTQGDPKTMAHHLDVDLSTTFHAAQLLRSALYAAACKQGLEPTNQPTTTTTTTTNQ